MQTSLVQKMVQNICGCLTAIMFVIALASCGNSDSVTSTGGKGDFVVARVGPIVPVRVGETADLSGQNSYTLSSQSMSFNWSFTYKPDTSEAVLLSSNTANPSFIADARGTYMVQLVVSAEGVSSERAIQQVIATVAPERPTGPFNHAGLSSFCAGCHNDDYDTILSKAGNHVATSRNCEACHTTLGFAPTAFTDHAEVFGNCSLCHDGTIAVGKSEFHALTNGECSDCHNTNGFFEFEPDGSYDHSGISRACTGCHNGTVSIGMTPTTADTPPGTHPDTNSECGYCHTVDSFLNAYPDHTGSLVNGAGITCDSCHNGATAQGTSVGHPDTSPAGDCNACHSIVTFSLGGVFNHSVDPAILACEVCHTEPNSINALGRTPIPPTGTHPDRVDCESCHTVDGFDPPISFDHTGITNDCASSGCHTGLVGEATGTHVNHLPLITPPGEDCSVCHSPGSFITGTFAHDVSYTSVLACADCHDEVISVGKLANHFPTIPDTQDCDDCHNTNTFVGATFDHTGIAGNNCASCHNETYTTTSNTLYGKPATHIPTSQDCSFCHTTGVPFSQDGFSHIDISTQCESCHNGDPGYVAVGAIAKKLNHIPAVNECDNCHVDTNAFASTTFSTTHDAITRGCEGCHTSSFFPVLPLIKATDHLPTNQDCYICHNINTFAAPTTMHAHTGITGNCTSCHDGSFTDIGARAKADAISHPETTEDCALCHNTTDFADAFVDHNDPDVLAARCDSCHGVTATGKDAIPDHVQTTQDCGTCHAAGGSFSPAVFDHTGIVDDCASCHDGVIATGKDAKTNPGHIATIEDCSVCHVPTVFAQAHFDHQNIEDNCGNCHDGTTVFGKHGSHVPTNEDCAVCHQTTGILPATFSHDGILDNCSSCHGVGFATPKDSDHVETGQDCGVCHTPSAFIPATFDHTGIRNNCASCHGVTATPKSNDHLATSLDCHFCHTTTTFVGGSWVHDDSHFECDSCHTRNGGATPMPGNHLSTTEQCNVCHTTNGWAPSSFSHSPAGDYPGDHRRDPGCSGCHGTIPDVDWGWSQYAPDCAACHAGDFESDGRHIGGRSGTVSQNRDCGRSGCHRVSDSDFD
ncbi:MAG: hypothetical protein GY820_08785 [Gammaproteobacteria bacterium]|nr:hypothetical protein [Gammaproteobacteria bacterium]